MSARIFCSIALMGLAALLSAAWQTGDTGARMVQVVYESDTRGYYLPCG